MNEPLRVAWLGHQSGRAGDGLLMFFDVAAKKVLKQEKAPIHIHDFLLSDTGETLMVAGHGRVIQYEMKV